MPSLLLMEHVTIRRDCPVTRVTFDLGRPSNPLSLQVMRELTAAARSFEEDTQTAAVILTGRADNFSLGFDLADAQAIDPATVPLAERRALFETGKRMCQAWADIGPLTISAIEGWCVGGGVALAVATDLRVASAASRFYVPEVQRGFNMSWGSVPRIVNLVGPARAKRLIVLAQQLGAEEALGWGLVDEVAAEGETLKAAQALAARAAALPPVSLRQCKGAIDAYANALAGVASHADHDQFALSHQSKDASEAVAAFLEKREASSKGE